MISSQKTALISRNITINKKRTSIRLEAQMWIALKEIAEREKCTIHDICTAISSRKSETITLTAAIRIFLMLYFKAAATEEGHKRAGHGGFKHMMARVANHNPPAYDNEQVGVSAMG
jgi:predicted DNA-binding ribbon-helix-helix protein